jgi:hypothetical protein
MSFDMSTLLAIVVFTSATVGCLLLVSWLQHRQTTALAYWGASFLLSALSAALIAARGEIANTWSIVVANAILVLGHGTLWSGTRNFEGRPISVLGTLAAERPVDRRRQPPRLSRSGSQSDAPRQACAPTCRAAAI